MAKFTDWLTTDRSAVVLWSIIFAFTMVFAFWLVPLHPNLVLLPLGAGAVWILKTKFKEERAIRRAMRNLSNELQDAKWMR